MTAFDNQENKTTSITFSAQAAEIPQLRGDIVSPTISYNQLNGKFYTAFSLAIYSEAVGS